MHKENDVRVIIPPTTILSIVATLLGLWVLYQVREVLFLFLLVVAIVVAFSPIIRWLQKYMPRTLAIALLYILLVLSLVILSALIIPPVVSQLVDFLRYVQILSPSVDQNSIALLTNNIDLLSSGQTVEALGKIVSSFQGSLGTFYTSTVSFVGGIIAAFTVFITSFYLLLEEKNFHSFLSSLVPHGQRERVANIYDRINDKMGDWLRGQFLLMVIIGLVDGIALAILGVPYALLLGLWAGLMEMIPFVGPILGAVPGAFLAFTVLGPTKGLIAILIYLIVQQIENQFLVPKIMGRALGLSPVVIIFSLLIGGKLLGFIGVIIAVPLAAALAVIFEEWRQSEK